MICATHTPVCSYTWISLSWLCRSAWGTKRCKLPCSYMAIFIRKSMATWLSSCRTGPPKISRRRHGKMPILAQIRKVVHFWYTSQKTNPDFPLFTRKIRVFTLIQTQQMRLHPGCFKVFFTVFSAFIFCFFSFVFV